MHSEPCSALLDHLGRPAFLLRTSGRLIYVNRQLERLLGVEKDALVAREEAGPGPPWAAAVRSALSREVDRTVVHASATVAGGGELDLDIEAVKVPPSGLAGFVLGASERDTGRAWRFGPDAFYDIDTTPGSFGLIRGHWSSTPGPPPAELEGKVCHRALHGREDPCCGCPLRATGPGPAAVTGVVAAQSPEMPQWIVDAQPLSADVTRMVVRLVAPALFTELFWNRVATLSSRARLTPREREVLEEILRGHSQREIAQHLGITGRTVKYHQTRLLDKLGADSRADLLRLVV